MDDGPSRIYESSSETAAGMRAERVCGEDSRVGGAGARLATGIVLL